MQVVLIYSHPSPACLVVKEDEAGDHRPEPVHKLEELVGAATNERERGDAHRKDEKTGGEASERINGFARAPLNDRAKYAT